LRANSLSDDLTLMRDTAIRAGRLAMRMKQEGTAHARKKADYSPLTAADLAVNVMIGEALRTARPGYGWLSEETVDAPRTRYQDRVWVVDPIDGTRAFMREQDPYWCIAISIVEQHEAIAAVLYAPMLDMLFEASAGGGAYLNGDKLSVSDCAVEAGCRMIAGKEMIHHKSWPEPWPEMTLPDPKPNATLLRMAMVATGLWDATIALVRKSDWDVAAGALLVQEAGGVATTHIGEPFRYNRNVPAQRSILAAPAALHAQIMQRVDVVVLPDPAETGNTAPRMKTSSEPRAMTEKPNAQEQLLHIVIGGELKDVTDVVFEDLSKIDFVGAFPNYSEAYNAWKSAAQRTVDHAETRYFILHAHKLLDPETGDHHHV